MVIIKFGHHNNLVCVRTEKRVLDLAMRKAFGTLSELCPLRDKNQSEAAVGRVTGKGGKGEEKVCSEICWWIL